MIQRSVCVIDETGELRWKRDDESKKESFNKENEKDWKRIKYELKFITLYFLLIGFYEYFCKKKNWIGDSIDESKWHY